MGPGHEQHDFVLQKQFIGKLFVLSRGIEDRKINFATQKGRDDAEVRFQRNPQLAAVGSPLELLRK